MLIGIITGVLYLLWDYLYWAKWVASVIFLYLRRRNHRKRFDLYDCEAENDPQKLGILVPKEEMIVESPFSEKHLQNAADEVFMYGVNSKKESLVVRVTRVSGDKARAWIYLKLKDGRRYELQESAGHQRNYGGKCTSFTCGGLQMHYLIPMRRWRIVYCGMLKERIGKDENKERKEVFVKFTFLWTASSDVYDASCEFDIRSVAAAMANAKWVSFVPPIDKLSEGLNFYCQSGVICGTVSIEDETDVEMYLFGERIRHLGKSTSTARCKFKHILGTTPESGLVIHIVKTSIPNTIHNLHFGFIVHPNSYKRVIQDGFIISRMSGDVESEEDLTVTFKAEKQYELRGKFVRDCAHFLSGQGWDEIFELIGIEFEINGMKGSGFVISGEIPEIFEKERQSIPPTLSTASPNRPFTVYFTEEVSHFTELTGGKGTSLAILTKLNSKVKSFVVPKGIIVTTAAYNEFLTSDIIDKVEKLKDIAYGNLQGNIQEACKIVMVTVEQTYFPDKIAKEIEEKINKMFGGNINQHKVAVRSSATGEDTDQMSAAGQMDSFLGVQGLKEILTAVKKCWASQFSYIATEYKRQNGQILNFPMAVVIQEMVECDAAGVIFTCDPLTSNPSIVVITGNYGLGETVVSGSEEPDTVVLKKISVNEVEIKSVTVGLKQHKIIITDTEEGKAMLVTEDIPEDKRNECCISQEIAKRLGKLSLKIEKYFKSPRDIEWGIKDNIIYILQSRPVTTCVASTDFEIKHEFDGPLRCEGDFFTVCSTGEVMPGATSPLGLDITIRYFAYLFQQKVMRAGEKDALLQHKYFASGFLPFYNHLSMSVLDVVTRAGDLDTTSARNMMICIFGRLLDDPDLKVVASYREIGKEKANLRFYLTLLQNLLFPNHGMKKLKKEIFHYRVPAEKGRTSPEIFDLLMHSCSHFLKPSLNHLLCSGMSLMWNLCLLSALENAKGCIDTDVYSDFAKLLSTSTNVESADIPSALQQLAHWIAKDIKSEDFKLMTVEEALEWLVTSSSSAGMKFRQFIERHGHRCLKESDLYSIPWGMDPKPLIKLLQNMAGSCEDVKEKKADDLSSILPQLIVPMSLKTKFILKFLLSHCRRGVREREAAKSILVKCMDNMRRGFLHLGKRIVAEGYLPDKELIFFLTLDEIQYLLETRNPRLIARANHRRKLYPTLDGYMLPDVWKGLAVPINDKQDEEVKYVADLTMKGIPVSQGSAKGYARVALTLEEASHIKPKEILITFCTDVGWSPYFPILAGVVTELGGIISHGAVVSREYGLPCIVGLRGATKHFVTGDFVFLDGNKGILQRLAPPEVQNAEGD